MMNMMTNDISPFDELPIGTKFNWLDVDLEVCEGDTCSGCYFNYCMSRCKDFVCSQNDRKDGKDVIFSDINRTKINIEYHSHPVLNRNQIIELIKKKYKESNNNLYKELLDEIG